MALTTEFLDAVAKAGDRSSGPLIIPCPMPGNLSALVSFSTFAEWRSFVLDLGLRRTVPDIVAMKFERSQKLHLLAWIDYDLVMAAELVAMTALELALKDRYLGKERVRRGKILAEKVRNENREATKKETRAANSVSFAELLDYMVRYDDLADDRIPMNQRCGAGKVIDLLVIENPPNPMARKPSLADRRNGMAHGDPFGDSGAGGPCAGLLELLRDLIDYAYRDWPSMES